MPKENTRYHLIDCIRGFTVLSMIVYHFLYDVFIVYGKNPLWTASLWVQLWQQTICWTFIFISGFVWPMGKKKNVRRGIYLSVCGLIISLVTAFVIPAEAIWFGVISFIGCAVLLMFPLDALLKRCPPLWGLLFSFLLFLLLKQVPSGSIGLGSSFRLPLPSLLYTTKLFTPFGFPFAGFRSSDYFPLLPWIFLFLCGYFSSKIFMEHPSWQQAARLKIPVLTEIGQNSLWIYFLHQPINLLICALCF